MSEKRSSLVEIAQSDLFEDGTILDVQGVGGRRAPNECEAGGGGYPNNCTLPNFSKKTDSEKKRRDPRFFELEKIGLPAVWLEVAERIGFDVWLEIWRSLSVDERVRHDGGARMPKLRCYSAYGRYQRNRYIEALAAQSIPPKQIQEALRKNLGEWLDITNIQRISKRAKVRS